jgi:carboxyl-terminal processing protease
LITAAWADPTNTGPNDRYITRAVTTLLTEEHLSRHPLNQEISQRMVGLFLKDLDPWKMYFYQSDVDAFQLRQGELVEKARKGDVAPAYTIFAIFLQRLDERVKTVDELLNQPQDFTVQEEMISDPEATQWPVTPADAYEKWRKRIKYELLSLKADKPGDKAAQKLTPEEAKAKLTRRYHSLAKRMHQTDSDELLEMYLTSLTNSFDPHTSYMSPQTMENFDIGMRLELEGIGAQLQSVDGYTVVNKLIPGGAAEKNGNLKVEDKVVSVGQGHDGELVDVVDMKLSDVVKLIRGKRGTIVRLEVLRGSNDHRVFEIVREKIELKDSEARAKVFEQGRRADGTPYKLGYIKLPSFYMDMAGARMNLPDYRSTTRDVRKILTQFNAEGVDAVVLDLRNNGGGSLTEAINLTGLFIGSGPVVQVKGPDSIPQSFNDTDAGIAWSKPLVVVTNKLSASASEILAGAIQDYHRGLVIGDKTTHGKGTVQSLLDLGQQLLRIPNAPSMGSLKITVQQFYRPNGDSTQNRGVVSDLELPSLTTQLDVGEADLDYSLPFDRVAAVRYQPYGLVTPEVVAQLRTRSAERTTKSEDFQKVLRSITRYKEQKERKRVTLNEKQFLEQRAELNMEKEEEKHNNPDQGDIKRDYYLNEVLAVTNDYLDLLSQQAGGPQLAGPGGAAARVPANNP